MKSTIRLAVILFVVCGLAAGSLALVAQVTREPIARQAAAEQRAAFSRVSPQAADFVPAGEESWDALGAEGKIGEVYTITARGYGGPMRIVVGTGTDRRLTGVSVVNQNETPGLGTKVAEQAFLTQFVGKRVEELSLRRDDSARGTIDAVTAATISSRAVTDALRQGLGGR
jgi:electron transport complex protein RnfG